MNDHLAWWEGDGGTSYMKRNEPTPAEIQKRTAALERILARIAPRSILEVGCGPGSNLAALHTIYPDARLFAAEPNAIARDMAKKLCPTAIVADGHTESLTAADASFDLVLTAGVLIHIPPDRITGAMAEIARVSRHYVLAIEYFAPEEEPIMYHGEYRIWRRDYGRLYVEQQRLKALEWDFFWKAGGDGYDSTVAWLMERS